MPWARTSAAPRRSISPVTSRRSTGVRSPSAVASPGGPRARGSDRSTWLPGAQGTDGPAIPCDHPAMESDETLGPVDRPEPDDRESAYALLQRGAGLSTGRHYAQAAIVLSRADRLE